MDWLWQLDHTIYRAIHVDMRREWLDPLFLLVTQTGLGHVQFATLIVACLPHRKRWIVPALVTLTLPIGFLNPATRDLFQYQVFVHGIGLAILLMAAMSIFPLELRRYALPALVSAVLSGAVRLLVVRLVDRQRPSNLFYADPLEHAFANTSFPSGHATTSFAIAFSLIFILRKSDGAWLGRWVLGWAILVGISRVYVGVHWPTDIVGAAGLGLLSAAIVHSLMKYDPPQLQEESLAAMDREAEREGTIPLP